MLSAFMLVSARIQSNLKILLETMDKIEAIIFSNIGGSIVCYPNKYTIKTINCKNSIQARNLKSDLYLDWIGETYNGRAF